jgi:hypothetical protein
MVALACSVALAPANAQRRRGRAHRAAGHRTSSHEAGEPQDLHGSKESVQKMYEFAQSHHLTFYLTATTLDSAIAHGKLVPLTGDSTYALTRGVGFSYASREVKQFVEGFAPQYLHACGTPLTVTSAARPLSRQPHNANPLSVHPTGIAVDIRRPSAGPCLTWVRGALSRLEEQGVIEATEEHHPVHLHIAVLAAPGVRVVLPSLTNGMPAAPRIASPAVVAVAARSSTSPTVPARSTSTGASSSPSPASPPPARQTANQRASTADSAIRGKRYVVRDGDTLWDVAQRANVSVRTLARLNHRSERAVLRPGTTLSLP